MKPKTFAEISHHSLFRVEGEPNRIFIKSYSLAADVAFSRPALEQPWEAIRGFAGVIQVSPSVQVIPVQLAIHDKE